MIGPSARPPGRLAALLALAVSVLPAGAAALEPRFDHRDEGGVVAELDTDRDSAILPGGAAYTDYRPSLRLAYGFDVSGEGDELFLGGSSRLGSYSDPQRSRVLTTIDARYRGYFGTDALKTFFELGAWGEILSRLAIGPLVSLGVSYDFSRHLGIYASVHFQPAIGSARIASLGAAIGTQVRFE